MTTWRAAWTNPRRAAAGERLGDLAAVRRECTDLLTTERRLERRRHWLDDFKRDLAFGARSAMRSPLFSLLTIVTLALGIGANAAVFGVVKSVLLDARPNEDGERLVRVYGRRADEAVGRLPLSPGAFGDYVERQHSFARVGAFYWTTYEAIYRPEAGPRVIRAAMVEPEFFETLGVRPVIGRTFTRAETAARAFVIMLSYDMWEREFGGDPGVIGTVLHIDADGLQVGVLPEDLWVQWEQRMSGPG